MGRLSRIATLAHKFVELAKNCGVTILDTRKTTSGLRTLEKYAVRAGGGKNHHFGLFDGILIKDNHIKTLGSVKDAMRRAKKKDPPGSRLRLRKRSKL